MNDLLGAVEPIYSGLPLIIRLITGEEIICTAYKPTDPEDLTILLDKPITITLDTSSARDARSGEKPTIKAKYSRWIPLGADSIYTIFSDNILIITPLDRTFVSMYKTWSTKLYIPVPAEDILNLDKDSPPAANLTSDEYKEYIDSILRDFEGKGRPH